MSRTVADIAAEIAEGFEGFSATPYRCPAGVWTIGYGSTRVGGGGSPVSASTPPVDRPTAHAWMAHEMAAAQAVVDKSVKVPLTANQKGALMSLIYNIGSGNFCQGGPNGSASTLLRKLNEGDYKGAAAQFDVWNRGGGRVLNGLVARRAAERKLFETA